MKAALQYLHEILTLLGDDRRKILPLVLLFLVVSTLDLASLGLIAPYIALVVDPHSMMEGQFGELLASMNLSNDRKALLVWLSGLLVFLFIAKAMVTLVTNNVIIRFAQNQQIHLRLRLLHHWQHLPYSIYLQRNTAEYIHAIQTLTTNFQVVLYHSLKTLGDVVVASLILSLLIWKNPAEFLILISLFSGFIFAYDYFFSSKIKAFGVHQNLASQEMIKGLSEGLEGFKEIKILSKESYFYNRVRNNAQILAFNERRNQLTSQAPRYLLEVILVIFVTMLVILSTYLNKSTHTLLGTLGIFGIAAIRMTPMASQLSATLTSVRFNRNSVARLYADIKLLNNNPKTLTPTRSQDISFKSLLLDNIQYAYLNTQQRALINLSLEIKAGESIGLVGPSGSGKTTLVDVLLGLLEPQSGTLEFNGQPLQEHLGEWRSQVAYLPQQVFLIDNSLRCNVALGEEESKIDETRLREALRQARLTELVEQLPEGLNTILGERGVRLSGGQRQRVALARAFYHGRSVLVMDEATSALDNETEKEIVAEIQRLKGQKTMIVIAHRLTTVQHCDRIYRLEQGKIVEEGTPDQVLKKASSAKTIKI